MWRATICYKELAAQTLSNVSNVSSLLKGHCSHAPVAELLEADQIINDARCRGTSGRLLSARGIDRVTAVFVCQEQRGLRERHQEQQGLREHHREQQGLRECHRIQAKPYWSTRELNKEEDQPSNKAD